MRKASLLCLSVVMLVSLCGLGVCGPTAEGSPPGATTRPAAAGRLAKPEIWMCYRDPLGLAAKDARWDFVKKHISGIKIYIGTLRKAPAGKLAALAAMLKENRIQVAVECGGTLGYAPLDETNGEKSAEIELRNIDKWYRAGGKVDYLDLDGPVRRLLYPKGKKGFTSVEKCAPELMDYMRAVRKAHPKIRFFLLTNFPNWGYRGGVSYHARGPKRQDWGDYDEVVRTVLKHAKEAGLRFAGVTVDNPYEYLTGEHSSVKLKDPTKVNWIKRVRAYEEFARSRGLELNLIANSERGGNTSDKAFYERTLKMVDAYVAAGGKPTRYIIQSWYPFPKKLVPEAGPHSMTALVRAAMLKLHPGTATRPAGTKADPAKAKAIYERGLAIERRGDIQAGIAHYYRAIQADPGYAPALNHFAWLRATNPDPKLRDPGEAVRLAERACKAAVDEAKPTIFAANCLDTLAVAYAAGGRFKDAVATQKRAIAMARGVGNRGAVRSFTPRLRLFEAGKPYRERPRP